MTDRKTEKIFLSPPHMGGEEMRFVREAFESNYIAPLGPQVDAFEREFAEYVDQTLPCPLQRNCGYASGAQDFGSGAKDGGQRTEDGGQRTDRQDGWMDDWDD